MFLKKLACSVVLSLLLSSTASFASDHWVVNEAAEGSCTRKPDGYPCPGGVCSGGRCMMTEAVAEIIEEARASHPAVFSLEKIKYCHTCVYGTDRVLCDGTDTQYIKERWSCERAKIIRE